MSSKPSLESKAITYEDLLISSKFFYNEDLEDSKLIFSDDSKEHQDTVHSKRYGNQQGQDHSFIADDLHLPGGEALDKPSALDVDIAMEAACGDSTFLVSTSSVTSALQRSYSSLFDTYRLSW